MNNKYSDKKIVWFQDKLNSFVYGNVTSPLYVRIKPTNKCMHRCKYCVYADSSNMHNDISHGDEIETSKLIEVLNDISDIGVNVVTFSGGGEPLAHRDAALILDEAIKCGLGISVITNGHLLNGERADVLRSADWVRISVDYCSPNTMEKMRGIDAFNLIDKNIRSFAAIKSGDLTCNFVVSHENVFAMYYAAEWLKDSGVENVRFSPVWVDGFEEYHKSIYEDVLKQIDMCTSLVDESFTISSTYNVRHKTKRGFNRCYISQTIPVIGADLNVYCCHNKSYDKDGLIGSILDKKFSELWFSEETRSFFEQFNPKAKCDGHQCSNEMKNEFICELVDAYGDYYV